MALTRLQKIIYGLGRLGSSALLNIASLATFYIYYTKYPINPVLNGLANSIGKISIAISGVVMGYISDATKHPKLGRRKPYITSGSFLLAISFIMLFFPDFLVDVTNEIMLFLHEAFWLALFNFSYGYLLTPYQAWMPEITEPVERSEVSGWENIFNLFGNIIGTGGSFAIPLIINNSKLLFMALVALAIVEIILYIPPVIVIQEPKKYLPVEKLTLTDFKIIFSDKNFDIWMLAQGTLSLGLVIVMTLLLQFLEFLGLIGMEYLTTTFSLMLVIFFSFFMWSILPKYIGVKKTMLYSIYTMAFFLLLETLRPLAPFDQAMFSVLMLGGAAFGISEYWILTYVVQANIIEMNARETGVSRAGAYIGVNGLVLNIFQAVGYVVTGYVVFLDPNYIFWSLIASVLIFLGGFIFRYVNPEISD